MSSSEWLTPKEAAAEVKHSERFILDELRRKNLRGSKGSAGWRIHKNDLDAYMEAHANVSRVRRAS